MNKILRYSFVALLAMVFAPSFAEDKTDELTWEGLGLNSTNSTYAAFEGKTFNSSAVYAGTASSGTGKYIQLRSNKSDAGIVTTASGGKLKSVTITFNEATTDRAIDIYGKNEAYSEGPDMYNAEKKGELIGSIAANGESMTITPSADYKYVGMVAHNGAIYIDKITVVWESAGQGGQTKAATTIEFSGDYETRATCGKDGSVNLPTVVVKAGGAAVEGATVTWESNNTDIATIDGNKVKIANGTQGEVNIKASYAGNDSYEASTKSYKLTVYKGAKLFEEMVKDVNNGNEKWDNDGEYVSYWFVNDELQAMSNTVTFAKGKYIYLTDGTYNLLFYGTNSLELKQGDVINGDLGNGEMGAVWGKLYRYNGLPEFSFTEMNVKVQSEGAAVTPKTITPDQLGDNINAYLEIKDAEYVSADSRNLTFKAGDVEFTVRQNWTDVSIQELEAGAVYTLIGMGAVYNTTNQLYLISYTKNDATGISTAKTAKTQNGAIYNIAGQKVSASYKGLVIMNGKKYVNK